MSAEPAKPASEPVPPVGGSFLVGQSFVTHPRCRCSESPEAWRKCPLPQHDHTKWTEHGWNCPPSCQHPDAFAARSEPDEPWRHRPPTCAANDGSHAHG